MKKYWKAIFNAIFLIVLVMLTVALTFRGRNHHAIMRAIHDANNGWLLLAVVLMVIFVCGESVIMQYLYRVLGTSIKLLRCIKYSCVGFFFSCVTPSATGGQPMQLYYMGKDKYKFSESVLVLLIITIGYKAALVVMSAVLFLWKGSFIVDRLDFVVYILIYGVVVNVAFIGFLLLMIFHETLLKDMIRGTANLLHKIHILKQPDTWNERMLEHLKPYEAGAAYLKEHRSVFAHVLWLSVLQRTACFMVPWCVYRSFGLQGISLVEIVALQTIIALSVDMLPLPGGVGASEKSFAIMFATIFGELLVIPGMILSRGISFYLLLAVTGCITILVHIRMMIKERYFS